MQCIKSEYYVCTICMEQWDCMKIVRINRVLNVVLPFWFRMQSRLFFCIQMRLAEIRYFHKNFMKWHSKLGAIIPSNIVEKWCIVPLKRINKKCLKGFGPPTMRFLSPSIRLCVCFFKINGWKYWNSLID